MVTMFFFSYFMVTYFYHEDFKEELYILQTSIPIFFNRYRYLLLSMGLLRERIIYNNSLSSFEFIPGYGYNADQYFHDLSIENDKMLQQIKITQPSILQKMIDFLLASDSTDFCNTIIGQKSFIEGSEDDAIKFSTMRASRGIMTTLY
jgi:hypothetical protein